MAGNAMYSAYKQCIVGDAAGPGHAIPNWETSDIRVVLVDHGTDVPNTDTDQDLADITAGARVAVSANLASKTAVLSSNVVTIDAADTTIASVSGSSCESFSFYNHTGTDSTSLLLVYFDTGVTNLPITPNGGDVVFQWHSGGIWAL